VEIEFQGGQSAVTTVWNRLGEGKRPPVRDLVFARNDRPADTVRGKVTFAVIGCNPTVPFEKQKEAK
jgi:hypothetical protein